MERYAKNTRYGSCTWMLERAKRAVNTMMMFSYHVERVCHSDSLTLTEILTHCCKSVVLEKKSSAVCDNM